MNSPQPISIWQPEYRQGELYFVRPEPLPLGDHYAAQRLIRARKDAQQKRICFFGESVAAGYLYAPHLTPAKWLAQQLQWLTADSLFEVVDLSRTNEMLATLVQTVAQAMQLQPDMLIIFAGNNWNLLETPEASPYYPSLAGRRAFAETWQAQGLWGPIELAAKQRLEKAGSALAQIGAIATAAQIPVVLIVPEVNLADWETRQPVSWLPGDGSARWHRLYQLAVTALPAQAWETAVSHA
jgi:hypothetical protein